MPRPATPAPRRQELPSPETVSVTTRDGVTLQCTYYPSLEGKKAIPVILLPGWERSRSDLASTAAALHKEGLAVITVDLRGHGASKMVTMPNGQTTELNLDRIRGSAFEAFVTQDLEAVKRFLMRENNEGKLNIEMLTIVGCDFSAIVALNFAQRDWSWPNLPAAKQGQDVKGLVLISPPRSFKGFNSNQALQHPAIKSEISIMMIVGEQNRTDTSDARRMYTTLEKIRSRAGDDPEDRTLFYAAKPTEMGGTALLVDPRANCLKDILFFTKVHLAALQNNDPWTDRTSLLD